MATLLLDKIHMYALIYLARLRKERHIALEIVIGNFIS